MIAPEQETTCVYKICTILYVAANLKRKAGKKLKWNQDCTLYIFIRRRGGGGGGGGSGGI